MKAIYTRQSIEKKDSISIETQIELCRRNIPDDEQYTAFSDKGYSGKNTNRPAFTKMMKEIEAGKIDAVIVYKLDRISRSLLDFVQMITVFEQQHVRFLSASESFDTSTAYGKAMMGILMVFAQLERETIQTRVKDNYEARGRKGYFLGGPPPYGFTLEKVTAPDGYKTSKYRENNNQIAAVIQMYEMYTSGMSLGQISSRLNEERITAAKGGNWNSAQISKTLASPVYVKADAEVYTFYDQKGVNIVNKVDEFTGEYGCYLYGKRLSNERKYTDVKDHTLALGLHAGVVDSAIWLKTQERLSGNTQLGNTGKGKHTWLSGIVKCGYCGYGLIAKTSANKKKTITYLHFACSGKILYKVCDQSMKPKQVEVIEKIVQKMIFERIKLMESTHFTYSDAALFTKRMNEIRLRLIHVEKEINHLLDFIAKGTTSFTGAVEERAVQLSDEKKSLEQELAKEQQQLRKTYNDDIKKYITGWDDRPLAEKKIIVQELIRQVNVTDDEVNIAWKV